MIEAIIFGTTIFILGFAAGVLSVLWWNSRRQIEEIPYNEEPATEEAPQPEKHINRRSLKTLLQNDKKTPAISPVEKKVKKDAEKTPAVVQPTDMVRAINDILQDLIRHSEKPGRVISLAPESPVGVSVWVNDKRYPDLDAVDDPSVKELVRKAVAEWERKASEKR